MLVIKIGGSVITNKKDPFSFNEDVIQNIAKQLTQINEKVILVHGVGSFGHPLAKKYRIGAGYDGTDERLMGLMLTHYWVDELSQRITKILIDSGLVALRCRPTTLFVTDNGRIVEFFAESIESFIQMGMIPVLHGDGPSDRTRGFSILSGDQITIFLAKYFKARKVIFGMDVAGIFSEKTLVKAATFDEIPHLQTFIRDNHDASGGLHRKLSEIQQLNGANIPVQLVGLKEPAALLNAVNNDPIGTTIN